MSHTWHPLHVHEGDMNTKSLSYAGVMDDFRNADGLSPADVYEVIRKGSGCPHELDDSLITLVAIDDALEQKFGSGGLYVLDDRSVAHVMSVASLPAVSEETLRRLHFGLSISQLAFRFATARKFQVANPSTKQLRVNSWGRAYCNERIDTTGQRRRAELVGVVGAILRENEAIYTDLGGLLRQAIIPPVAERISGLNSLLKLKLVS
jgi:hypothetical protein